MEQLQNTPLKSRRGGRASRLRVKFLRWLDHGTRQLLMCWLRVYAWRRVKIKAKSIGVCSVLSCKLDHRTRQFIMCWLRVDAWLRVKIKLKGTGVRIVLSWIIERGNFLCAGYTWLRVYSWLRVKIKAKSTGVHSVLSCKLDHRTRQFLMCWLHVATRLRVATRQN